MASLQRLYEPADYCHNQPRKPKSKSIIKIKTFSKRYTNVFKIQKGFKIYRTSENKQKDWVTEQTFTF